MATAISRRGALKGAAGLTAIAVSSVTLGQLTDARAQASGLMRRQRQKATREPSRVAFETNCRSESGSVRRFERLTNTDAPRSGIRVGGSARCGE